MSYQLAGQQSSLPGHSLEHIWLQGPPVVSPSSCSIPWHRGITCLCCFRNIHHLTPRYAVRISRGALGWGSQTLCQRSLECFPFMWEDKALTWLWSLETDHLFHFSRVRWPLSLCALAECSKWVLGWTAPLWHWTEKALWHSYSSPIPSIPPCPAISTQYHLISVCRSFFLGAQMGHNLPTRSCEK